MHIDRAEGWHRKKRKCEHCGNDILKEEPIILLFADVIKFPAIYRGVAYHEECSREELTNLIDQI